MNVGLSALARSACAPACALLPRLLPALIAALVLLPAAARAQYDLVEDAFVSSVSATVVNGGYALPGSGARIDAFVRVGSTPPPGPTVEEPAPFVGRVAWQARHKTLGTIEQLNLDAFVVDSSFRLINGFAFSWALDGERFEFARHHPQADWKWYLVVRLDDAPLAAPDPNNNEGEAAIAGAFTPLSGHLYFGPVDTQLFSAELIAGPCGPDRLLLVAGSAFYWEPSPSQRGAFEPVVIDDQEVCVRLGPDGPEGHDLLAETFVRATTYGPVLGDASVQLDVALAPTGCWVLAASARLPTGVRVFPPRFDEHVPGERLARPDPRGVEMLHIGVAAPFPRMYPIPTADLANLVLDGAGVGEDAWVWIKGGDVPVSLRITRLTLLVADGGATRTANGRFGNVHYSHRRAFGRFDRRHETLAPSNDVRFDTAASEGRFGLEPDGLSVALDLTATPLDQNGDPQARRGHFPDFQFTWGAHRAEVQESRLVRGPRRYVDGTASDTIDFDLSSACPGCGGGAVSMDQTLAATEPWDDAHGEHTAAVTGVGLVGWGPGFPFLGGALPTFFRLEDGDRRGRVVMPGWTLGGTATGGTASGAPANLARLLLGSAQVVEGEYQTLRPLESAESRAGNYFFAGVTMGPAIYRDGAGQPVPEHADESLDGKKMFVAFIGDGGVRTISGLQSNPGVKYVLRPGGVTGVFNFTGTPDPMPAIYGYDMSFAAPFAFRLWANQMDEESWVQGEVRVPAPGGFDVDFESMTIECTGQLGGGRVIDDGNKDQLVGWKTPFQIRALEFVPAGSGGTCSLEPRVMKTGGSIVAAALTKPLDVSMKWAKTGIPSDLMLTGDTHNVLDQAEADGLGFGVQLDKGGELGINGAFSNAWFGLPAKFNTPFWDAIDANLRLQNASGGAAEAPVAAPSIAHVPGTLVGGDEKNDDLARVEVRESEDRFKLFASYTWVEGFDLKMPVTYAGYDTEAKRTRFLGKSDTTGLAFIEVMKGVDFIDPERTKVSFGASANLEKLRLSAVKLNIDLNDPRSIEKADDWLASVGLGRPLGPIVGAVREPGSFILRYVGPGVRDLISQGIKEAVGALTAELTKLAGDLNFVQSLPAKFTGELFGLARTLVDDAIGKLGASIDAAACDVYDTASAGIADVVNSAHDGLTAAEVAAIDAVLPQLEAALGAIEAAKTATGKIGGALADAQKTIDRFKTEANTKLGEARTGLESVRGKLRGGFSLLQCGDANPVTGKIKALTDQARTFANALSNNAISSLVSSLGGLLGLDTKAFLAAQTSIGNAAKALLDQVDNAVKRVNTGICGLAGDFAKMAEKLAHPDKKSGLLDKVQIALTDVQNGFDKLVGAASPIVATVNTWVTTELAKLNGKLTGVHGKLKDARDALKALRDNPTAWVPPAGHDLSTQAGVQAWLDAILLDSTGVALIPGKFCEPGGKGIASRVGDEIRTQIGGFLGTVAADVNKEITAALQVIPFPTPEMLTTLVEKQLFNSDVVAKLDKLVHDNLTLMAKSVNDLGQQFLSHINKLLKEAVDKFNALAASLIEGATGAIKAIPIKTAKMDGYAVMNHRELERLHIDAAFTWGGGSDPGKDSTEKDSKTTFAAALDVTSWAVNGKGKACVAGGASGEVPGEGILDAQITTRDLPISIGTGDLRISLLMIGVTLEKAAPVGVYGSIQTVGALSFAAFKLINLGLEAGVGKYETYLGAKGAAVFQGIDIAAAFLAGRTCNGDVLGRLDPEAAEFITLPGGLFQGVYARGSASIPIITGGCALTVGAGVDVGFWLLFGGGITNIGGILGGSAYGEAICFVGLRGGVKMFAEVVDGNFRFRGTGYGVGGIGFDCDPETWTSIPRSRDDDWCATGDAALTVEYVSGFDITDVSVDAIF